jgi:uncharacterized membrane protein
MKFNINKELPLIGIVLVPFLYLSYIWQDLPGKVPIHWNVAGEIDRYGDKIELLIASIVLPLLSYCLFLIIPLFDSDGKIQKMGEKFQNLKFGVILSTSLIAIFIIYSSQTLQVTNINVVFGFLAVMFIVIGNYMKSMGQNYFIGIRTPWTLKNEKVWREVHTIASYLWVGAGIVLLLMCLVLPNKILTPIFFSIIILITLGPVIQSYLLYKKYTAHA